MKTPQTHNISALQSTLDLNKAQQNWLKADEYVLTEMAAYAASVGRLDELLTDPRFLVAAQAEGLGNVLHLAGNSNAQEAAKVYALASNHMNAETAGERAAYLELAARQQGEDKLADQIRALELNQPWSAAWAYWERIGVHYTLGTHENWVSAVVLAKIDSHEVAVSGGRDGAIRVWRMADGEPLYAPLTGHEELVLAVAVGELDGQPVAVSGGSDGTVRRWNLTEGNPLGAPMTGHDGWVAAVALAKIGDQEVVVSGGGDGTVRVRNLVTGDLLYEPLLGHEGPVSSLATGELDGRPLIVSGGLDGKLVVRTLIDGRRLYEPINGHKGCVRALASGASGGRPVIVSGGHDATIRAWSLADDKLIYSRNSHRGWVAAVAVGKARGRSVIISGSYDQTLRVWDLNSGEQLYAGFVYGYRPHMIDGEAWIQAVALTELDRRPVMISGDSRGSVRIWNLAEGKAPPFYSHRGTEHSLLAVGELDGSPVVVTGGTSKWAAVWSTTGRPIRVHTTGHEDRIESLAVTELNGRQVIVSGSWDKTVRVADLADGEPLYGPLMDDAGPIFALAAGMFKGRRIIASGGRSGAVTVRYLATGKPLYDAFQDHPGPVAALAIGDAEGRSMIVSGGRFGEVVVRDMNNGQEVYPSLTDYTRLSWLVIAELDGRPIILALGADGKERAPKMRIWRLADGELQSCTSVPGAGKFVVGEIGGQLVMVKAAATTVKVFNLKTSALLRVIDVGTDILNVALVAGSGIAVGTLRGLLMLRDIRI